MDAALRARIEQRLSSMRSQLLQGGDLEVSAEIDPTRKVDEDAAPLAEMSQVIASNRNRARAEELREIEAAMARLRDDPEGFGLCETCDDPIGAARLEVRPWVRLCIECQQADEREHGRGGARRHLTDYR
ncbi:MAG: TraR/DksA C4-type zinc finger protein [Nannocystaceae bacterium]|nr:TraR/DksA C4-type zinc finger protein [Nannocystaceae bacterium]